MKCFISSLLILWGSASWATIATYRLKWDTKNLPITTTLYEGNMSLLNRVAENGELKDISQLPTIRRLEDGVVKLIPGEYRVLILVVQNNSKSDLRFAVAPHSIQPTEASLGMSFNCLCNGHKYEVKAGKSWYRILELKTFKPVDASPSEVVLEHKIFSVK